VSDSKRKKYLKTVKKDISKDLGPSIVDQKDILSTQS